MSEFNAIQHDRSAAIKVALGAFLDPQQTARAVGLWHEKYAAQPTFSVQYFVRECCALFGVESLRNQLVQSLVLELDGPRAEADVLTFQLLFRALTDSAGQLRGREISRYVADGLVKMPLAKDVKRSLELWLNRDMPVIEAVVPIPVMVTLVNRAYIGLCEYCGPVKADQMLHECVGRVASMPAAQQFHPRELL